MDITEEITPEQDASHLARLSLWAEVLKNTVEDLSGGLRIGALTADLAPTRTLFSGPAMEQSVHAREALEFLRSHGGVRLCDMFHCTPEWVLRRAKDQATVRDYALTNSPRPRKPRHDLAGSRVKTWTVTRLTDRSTACGRVWLCRCSECRAEREFPTKQLRLNLVALCGCQSKAALAAAARGKRYDPTRCMQCGQPMEPSRTGQTKLYCGWKCRSLAESRQQPGRLVKSGDLTAAPRG